VWRLLVAVFCLLLVVLHAAGCKCSVCFMLLAASRSPCWKGSLKTCHSCLVGSLRLYECCSCVVWHCTWHHNIVLAVALSSVLSGYAGVQSSPAFRQQARFLCPAAAAVCRVGSAVVAGQCALSAACCGFLSFLRLPAWRWLQCLPAFQLAGVCDALPDYRAVCVFG
jgi:hypothetical protein